MGTSLKARSLIFWILALYICIKAPVKTEFAKSIIWSIFRGGPSDLGFWEPRLVRVKLRKMWQSSFRACFTYFCIFDFFIEEMWYLMALLSIFIFKTLFFTLYPDAITKYLWKNTPGHQNHIIWYLLSHRILSFHT